MTQDLSVLIARLEMAEDGSKELDGALTLALTSAYKIVFRPGLEDYYAIGPGGGSPVQPFTTSLDAALSLASWKVPSFTVDITAYRTNAGEFRPKSTARLFCPYGEISEYRAAAPTPALALVSAILKAVEAGKVEGRELGLRTQEDGRGR